MKMESRCGAVLLSGDDMVVVPVSDSLIGILWRMDCRVGVVLMTRRRLF